MRRRTKRTRRTTVASMLVAGVALLLLAGCGGSDDNTSTTIEDGMRKYSACMRDNGVPAFPDPVNGRVMLQSAKGGGGIDPSSPQFQSAERACASLAPAGLHDGAPSAELQEQGRKFSACMRKNGVPDFPDPSSSAGKFKYTGVDPNAPGFESAQQACHKLAPGGAP